MKVTYTIWVDKHCSHSVERTFDSFDYNGIRDFDQACELRENRAVAEALKKELDALKPKDPISLLQEEQAIAKNEPRDDGPHKRVYEYDGAMNCLDCHALWGALPGKPEMPTLCLTERINAL